MKNDKRWVAWVVFGVISFVWCLSFLIHYVHGLPAPPCRDEVEIRTSRDSRFTCSSPGAKLETYPSGTYEVLVKCICPNPGK